MRRVVARQELAAMQQCLKPLGEAASEIGMDRPLSSYTQQEALQLINAVVTTYVEAMVQEHERSKYPPVRMPGTAPVHDPIRESAQAAAGNPFADMKDDLPWETT